MWFVTSVGFWLLAVAAHAVLCRLRLPFTAVGRFLLANLAIGTALAWLVCRSYGIWSAPTFSALLVFGFLSELYLFLSTLAVASISATVLLTLRNRSLSEEQLSVLLNGQRMVSLRVERLLAAGLLSESASQVRLTAAGTILGTRFLRLKAFLGHTTAAHDHAEP